MSATDGKCVHGQTGPCVWCEVTPSYVPPRFRVLRSIGWVIAWLAFIAFTLVFAQFPLDGIGW